MTFVAPESAPVNATRIPSIVILGADALLAALPATPVQLAHACVLAGYQSVVPASWGDELIAAASLRDLREHGQLPAIQCSCPYVAHRLLAVGTDLRPFLVSLVAPPVALARYLRAAQAPGRLRITYVGRCPGAADASIDARLTPEELLAMLGDRQIALEEQPLVYDSVLPPDRRRYRSQPGGLPTPEMLWSASDTAQHAPRTLVELYGDDLPVELAQHLLSGKPVLIDCATKLGCVCSGAAPGVDAAEARARIVALEPPRSPRPIIDENLLIDTALPLPASPRSAIDVVAPVAASAPNHGDGKSTADDERPHTARHEEPATHQGTFSAGAPPHGIHSLPPRRLSPPRGIARPAAGSLPTARDAGGRQLPRTYVAHRRAPSRLPRSDAAIPRLIDGPADLPAMAPTESELPNAAADTTPLPAAAPASERIDRPPAIAEHGATRVIDETQLALTALDAPVANVPARAPAQPSANVPNPNEPRYAERPVALPVTPRSDAAPGQELAPHSAGERPLMQLLTLGLLISMIVLVSAAVGVLVGRWMTQH